MANSLESLKILAGGPNVSNFGALPQRPVNINRNQAAVMAKAKALGIPELADGSVSEEDIDTAYGGAQQDALKKLLLPAQIKAQGDYATAALNRQGQLDVAGVNAQAGLARENVRGRYNVDAASQRAQAQADRDAVLFGNRQTMAEGAQRNLLARQAATAKQRAITQRIQGLQTGKVKADRAGGIMDMLFGPSQADLNNAEIQKLMGELTTLQSAPEGDVVDEAAAAPAAPAAGGVDPARLARLRAAMGR
jgi:hypothetical protein